MVSDIEIVFVTFCKLVVSRMVSLYTLLSFTYDILFAYLLYCSTAHADRKRNEKVNTNLPPILHRF